MLKKTGKVILGFTTKSVLVVSVTLCIALFCGFLWIATSPRSISQFIPEFERSLSSMLPGKEVKIRDASLSFSSLSELLNVRASGVSITDAPGSYSKWKADFNEIYIDFDILSLLRGKWIPQKLTFINPSLEVPDPEKGGGGSAAEIFNEFFPENRQSITQLNELALKQAHVTIVSPAGDTAFLVKEARLKMSGHSGKKYISAYIKAGSSESVLRISASLDKSARAGAAQLALDGFPLSSLSKFCNSLDWAEGIDLSVTGKAALRFDAQGGFQAEEFSFKAPPGAIGKGKLFDGGFAVSGVELEGSYANNPSTLTISKAGVILGEAGKGRPSLIMANGRLVYDSGIENLAGNALMQNIPAAGLRNYWPLGAAPNPREWITEHMTGGVITKANASFNISRPDLAAPTLPDSALKASISFSGLNVDYLPPLLPVAEGEGEAVFNGNSMNLEIKSARLGSSAIKQGTVKITDIGGHEQMEINGEVEGNSVDLADFYVKLAKRRYFDSTEGISGTATSKVHLAFPLLADLPIEKVNYKVESALAATSVPHLKDYVKIENGNGNLTVNNDGFDAAARFIARDVLPPAEGDRYTLIEAPADIKISQKGDDTVIEAALNIEKSTLSFPEIDYSKPPGEKGTANFRLSSGKDGLQKVESFDFKTDKSHLQGNGVFTPDFSDFNSLNLTSAIYGKNNYSLMLKKDLSRAILYADLKGESHDAAKLIKDLDAPPAKDQPAQDRLLMMKAELKEAALLNGKKLDSVQAVFTCTRKKCQKAEIKGLFNHKDAVSISISSYGGGRALSIMCEDAGSLLSGLDYYNNINGGKLDVSASLGENDTSQGTIRIRNFKLVKAPAMAKILSLASFTGLADTLSGEGISMSELVSSYSKQGRTTKIQNFKTSGESIGMTAAGTIDGAAKTIDVQGNIIPVYAINSLLGATPIIGDILKGKNGSGIVEIRYSLKGKIADPQVSINPISAVTPGVVEDIFETSP